MIDPRNLKEVVQILQFYGVERFKSSEFEISFRVDTVKNDPQTTESINNKPCTFLPTKLQEEDNPSLTPEKEEEIKHKVEELTSVMKMSDTDLVDQLFPDHTKEEEPQDGGE